MVMVLLQFEPIFEPVCFGQVKVRSFLTLAIFLNIYFWKPSTYMILMQNVLWNPMVTLFFFVRGLKLPKSRLNV